MKYSKSDVVSMFCLDTKSLQKILETKENDVNHIKLDSVYYEVKNEGGYYLFNEIKMKKYYVNGDAYDKDELSDNIKTMFEDIKKVSNNKKVLEALNTDDIDNEIKIIVNDKNDIEIYENVKNKYFLIEYIDRNKKPIKESIMNYPIHLVDGSRYVTNEKIICIDKNIIDYFDRGNDSFFGENTLKEIINSFLLRDSIIESGTELVYSEDEGAFINEETDLRVFVNNEYITFNITEIDSENNIDLKIDEDLEDDISLDDENLENNEELEDEIDLEGDDKEKNLKEELEDDVDLEGDENLETNEELEDEIDLEEEIK